MLQNATATEILKGRVVSLSVIADMKNGCSFGSCARVILMERDSQDNLNNEVAHILVDYPNRRVVKVQYTDGW